MDTFAPHVLLGFTRDASRIDFSPVRFSIVLHKAGKLLLAQGAHSTLHCELPGRKLTQGWKNDTPTHAEENRPSGSATRLLGHRIGCILKHALDPSDILRFRHTYAGKEKLLIS